MTSLLLLTYFSIMPAEALTEGMTVPYSPRTDDVITTVLLGCFFLSSYVIARSGKFLAQLAKDFLLHRERTSIFATSTATDVRYLLLLILQTCVLTGVAAYVSVSEESPAILGRVSGASLLSLFVAAALIYLFLKWLIYVVCGWIFFDKPKTSLWLESYSSLLYYFGFALFPLVLFVVYFDADSSLFVIIGSFLLVFVKILILFKWVKLFCYKIYGTLSLIVYFCAVEVAPLAVFCKGMTELTRLL